MASVARRALLLAFAALCLLWVYWVWQRVTATPPPDVSLEHVEPLVAEAVSEARQAVIRLPRSAARWGELGMTLHAHNFLGAARHAYVEAERLDASNPYWPYLIGDCLWFEARRDEALASFRTAVERSGTDQTARLRLGEASFEQGLNPEAESQFRAVLAAEDSNARARVGLARVLLASGNAAEALVLATAAKDKGGARDVDVLMPQILRALGRDVVAGTRSRADDTDQPWPDRYLVDKDARHTGIIGLGRRATALYRAGRKTEALAVVTTLATKYPDSLEARKGMGRMLALLGSSAEAETHLRAALEIAPEDIDARFILGTVLMDQRRYWDSMAALRTVLQHQPDHAEAYLRLAQCLYAVGDKPAAAEATRQAVRHAPDSAKARKNLGVVLFELGRYDEAVPEIVAATQLAPDDAQLAALLERARRHAAAGR